MKATITKIIDEAFEIKSFQLQAESPMVYTSGQWMYVRLSPDLKHHFTISSSPTENFLQFTTKFRPSSDYKQALWKLSPGSVVDINGPFGSFVLNETDPKPKLFIAGGIGITPFRSMIKYITDKKLDIPIKLLHSVSSKTEAAFNGLPFTEIVESKTQGRLDASKIKKLCPDWLNREWWICGPPAMVEALVELAHTMGVSIDKIKSEEFTGY